ncbi:ferredoxin [Microbacterium sp.]|uniref:ferredoxin n=1 Tax=Microbacterium sp. TaxID=51671 RepID=UPI002734E622|nr:ferredoxin [Microbacterium sp.]MDP3950422.1 ferredoxin [Microbacterium sp.]
MRIKLDRTVCDGFGTCALHAPEVFSLDDWGYPSLVGNGEIAPEHEDGVRRALLDCPAHAIVELGTARPMPAGGEAGVARNSGPDAPWHKE